MKHYIALALAVALSGCVTVAPPPSWNTSDERLESEHAAYADKGTSTISGQAFLTQAGGSVVKAAGRNVTLDPATTIGDEWWGKAGKYWAHRHVLPPSPAFIKARRTVVADADGKFSFKAIPAGKYYVRTEVTWEVGGYVPTQGGLVGQLVEVRPNDSKEVILNQYPQ